jgi:glycosyltransferase involved in cell wall biosynthesis
VKPLSLLLVGPLPPPPGGMANQTRQLAGLLAEEGISVQVVRTNADYRPTWVSRVKGLRAIFRFVPYVCRLYRTAACADVAHVMANSGWAWHLLAAPAIVVARLRDVPIVVNYRGGLAEHFLARQAWIVRRVLRDSVLVVPTEFLRQVFARHGMKARTVPNVVDLARFHPVERVHSTRDKPHIVVTRNLEHLYGNDLALQAFALIKRRHPGARMSIAGSGPERAGLEAMATRLGVENAVTFTGRLEGAAITTLYQDADLLLNPSRADNTPNAVLEALACGVPVVSTDVGGVPFLVEHGRTALLVPAESPEALADAAMHVLGDAALRDRLVMNGLETANDCSWGRVKSRWLSLYDEVSQPRRDATDARRRVPS